MASKKIQNFVKNKVNASSNINIPFSKIRLKSDSLEEPLIFDNLEKEFSPEDIGETNYGINSNNSNFDDYNLHTTSDVLKCTDETEILPDNPEISNTTNLNNPILVGVEKIGKSVNIALKDAHIAINSIMKDSQKKKNIRKPSDVAKSRYRFSSFSRKRYFALEDEKMRSLSLTREDVEENFTEATNEEGFPDIPFPEKTVENNNENVRECPKAEVDFHISDSELQETVEDTKKIPVSEIQSKPEENIVIKQNNNNETQQSASFTNLKIIGGIGALISIFFLFSISKFVLGLICGILMSFGIFKIYESFFIMNAEEEMVNSKNHPQLRQLPSPVIPHIEERMVYDEYASSKAYFSAWINAVNSYHPSWYNLNASYSLHLSLEGTKMRMRTPKNKIPSRAMWNERKLSGIVFISERTVELLHAKVLLLPYGLVRRRMWSKKYPICITINKGSGMIASSNKPAVTLPQSKSFENLSEASTNEEHFFFFTRTCREKEELFRRLMAASLGMPITLTITNIIEKYLSSEVFASYPIPLINTTNAKEEEPHIKSGDVAKEPVKDEPSNIGNVKTGVAVKVHKTGKEPQIVSYVRYMAKFMPSDMLLLKAKSQHIDLNYIQCDSELLWLNALFGRVAWDIFRGTYWSQVIREKIQKKLKKLHLPYFIDKLEIIDIDLGNELPVIRKVSRPYLDYRGLWVEFEMVYAGGFSMGLETKINLMKLKNVAAAQRSSHNKMKKTNFTVKYNPEGNITTNNQSEPIDPMDSDLNYEMNVDAKLQMHMATGGGTVNFDESEDDRVNSHGSSDESFASSTESDASIEKCLSENEVRNQNPSQGSSSNKSFIQWVDKIARSAYFQKAADNKYVQKTMEYVSNTSLALQVDAAYLNGTLVINIPPPPSDRLWWGFKKNPELQIKARPKVGQKEIHMTKIVEFIEKKLIQEFQRAVVLPNMDDIAVPLLLNGSPENYNQNFL